MPVSEKPGTPAGSSLDTIALGRYLRLALGDFPEDFEVSQVGYGQSNPTFIIKTGGKDYVLRKKPPGRLLPSAHALEREYRLLTALQKTDVPVPRPYIFCGDSSVIGTSFYLMEKVEGRIFRDSIASSLEDQKERASVFDAMNDALASLHNVEYKPLGLSDFGKPGKYLIRQINRWTSQYRASQTHTIPAMEALIKWLPENIPDDESTSIVHGDFRLENLVFHHQEARVEAVLDWELSTLGHPLADLAYNCLSRQLPHFQENPQCPEVVDIEKFSVPMEQEYLAAYCRRTGRAYIRNWRFFLAFSMFRIAAISQGVYKRGIDGNASSETALSYINWVRCLADRACSTISSKREV